MMKLTFYFVLIYQFAQLTQGFETLQSINKLVFTPPGCIACYKTEANNYFRNLNRLSPNCAEEEINSFNTIPAKYFLAHICVYQRGTGFLIGTGFQSKYDSLQNHGNQVLREFRKCLKGRLSPAGKNYLEQFTAIFENARITCESGNFLEKGLKGIRQLYIEPPPPLRRRGQRHKSKKQPASKKLIPVTEVEKATIDETLPSTSTFPSEQSINPQENGEIQENSTDVARMGNNNGTAEEIVELSSNAIEQQNNADDINPTPLESSVDASEDEPSSIENSDNPQKKNEMQPNETDVVSMKNDNGSHEGIPELPSNAIEKQNDVDPTTLEDSVDMLGHEPSSTKTNNLAEKVQDGITNPTPSVITLEDHSPSIMTDNLKEKVQDKKVTLDNDFHPSENLETPNDQSEPHTSGLLEDKILNNMTSDDTTLPAADLETFDDQFVSPTTDTPSENQVNELNPENGQDSTSNQSASLINKENIEDSPQMQIDNLSAQVDPTLLPDNTFENLSAQDDPTLPPDNTFSDNLHDEASGDHSPPVVTDASDKVQINPLTNEAIAEDFPPVQDLDNTPTQIQEENVPLEETLTAAPIDNIEPHLPENPSINDSSKILEPEDILKSPPITDDKLSEKSLEAISDDQIESPTNGNISQDLLQSRGEDDLTPLDKRELAQNYDSSVENLSELSSMEQPTPKNIDIQTLQESLETTKDQSASTANVVADDLIPDEKKDAPKGTLKSSLDDISLKETPEEIDLSAPLETKDPTEESHLPQEINLQTGDDNSALSKIDISSENLETKSEDEIITQINDQVENSDTKLEDEIIPQINNSTAENLNEAKQDNSIITGTPAPVEALSDAQFEDPNDFLPDHSSTNVPSGNSSKIEENIPTPEIISKSELNDSATENTTKYENSDDASKKNNEITPTDPGSLEPMNLVERVSTTTDDTTLSQDRITETSSQEIVSDESPTPLIPQDDTPSKFPTKAELYEKLHNPLTHFSTDTALGNNLEPVDEIISKNDSKNIENSSEDKIDYRNSDNSEIDSLSDSSELKDQDLNEQDQNLGSSSTSLEDDSIKIEASDSSSTNNLLDTDVGEKTHSPPPLENLPATETNSQIPENISPASDPTSLEDYPMQEDTPKLELSEESESVPHEEIENFSSNPEDMPSSEESAQSNLISKSDMNEDDESENSPPSGPSPSTLNDSLDQDALLEDHPLDSASSSENQTSIPQTNEPHEGQSESVEINPTTVQIDQASLPENQPSIAQDNVSEETPSESTVNLETNISDSSQNQLNANPIQTERDIESHNQDKVEGKTKEMKDDILNYEKEKNVIS